MSPIRGKITILIEEAAVHGSMQLMERARTGQYITTVTFSPLVGVCNIHQVLVALDEAKNPLSEVLKRGRLGVATGYKLLFYYSVEIARDMALVELLKLEEWGQYTVFWQKILAESIFPWMNTGQLIEIRHFLAVF